jgi:hypothetical protein
MGFSTNSGMVRGELFTENGKWKYTISLDMNGYWNKEWYITPYEAVHAAFRDGRFDEVNRYPGKNLEHWSGWWLAVLDPYHERSYPVLLKIDPSRKILGRDPNG